MNKRRQLIAARTAALIATIVLHGRSRIAAWTLHEILRLVPTLLRNCDWHGPIARRFHTTEREVWLTVDDGPDAASTPAILDLLAQAEAKASFFVVGEKLQWQRTLCRRMVSEGHTLENHTFSHPSATWWAMPSCAIREEIIRCSHAIRVATGLSPTWFRSPVGMTNSAVHPIAARGWMRLAGWSADGYDGLPYREPSDVVARILRQVTPGSIILVHEGKGRRSEEVLSLLLGKLRAAGLRCVIPKASTTF